MALIPIDAPHDPRAAEYAAIGDPELVRARGLFVAEGRLIVRRLIEDGRLVVRSVLVSEAAQRDLAAALERLPPAVPVHVCPASYFRGITGFDIHRGCLALAERPARLEPDDVLSASRLVVVLESVANADNVGGVFRNAAAFGADAVLMNAGTCDPLYRKAIRTSMAATLRVPFARLDSWPDDLARVRAAGLTLVALTPREPSQALDEFAAARRGGRLALLVGSEGDGLSAAAEAAADTRVRIPTTGAVDSLNVAVAAGIALSRLTPLPSP